jgi:hypothetical protein
MRHKVLLLQLTVNVYMTLISKEDGEYFFNYIVYKSFNIYVYIISALVNSD